MSKSKLGSIFLVVFSLIILIPQCKDSGTGNDLNEIVFPASNVSYAGQVEPLFLRGCAYSGCHDSQTIAAGLDLETYEQAIFSKPGVIIAGDTTNSRLIWSVTGKNNVPIMPLTRPPLNANQVAGLKRWILEGARNN